jgi:hypothetical protein
MKSPQRPLRDVIFASTLLMLGAFFSQDWVVVGDKGLFNYIDIGGLQQLK